MAPTTSTKSARLARKAPAKRSARPPLLAGGNPRIAKADGDAPVRAYIAAMPGWKRDIGRRLDALIERAIPGVRKAVKWNSPLYAVEGEDWFLGIHCLTNYVKIAFFRGAALHPVPPVGSKNPDTRYLHIHAGDELDEARLTDWVKQASQAGSTIKKAGTAMKKSVAKRPAAEADKADKADEADEADEKGGAGAGAGAGEDAAAGLIDAKIAELGDWRGEMLARLRAIIRQADPEVVEEWKWSVPVWSHAGIICTGESYKKAVKMTFARGAALDDPAQLFNSSLEGNVRRAIDVHEGEEIDEKALKALIRAAVKLNTSALAAAPAKKKARSG
jgi:hypothetical protein